jgi:ATP-dependent helicase/nuclease subunit A
VEVLSALAPEGVNLTVVGDEKQSIYAFRGADVRLFQQARTRIEERCGANRALSRSFRTHADLVEVTNAFFGGFMPGPTGAGSTAATFRPLSAHRQGAPHPSLPCEFHVITSAPKVNTPELREAEAALIAHRIQSLLCKGRTVQEGATSRPLSYRDVAVLLRVWTNLYLYEEALFRAGIPYTVQGGRGLLDRPEVRDLTQLLQLWRPCPTDSADSPTSARFSACCTAGRRRERWTS